MRENLPKELDFTNEARNARKAVKNFEDINTSLYIPEVISADKRVLIMEFIEGARVDDLEYLAAHKIDRNKVSLELSRIFSQMVYIDGWFHAVSSSSSRLSDATDPSDRTLTQVFAPLQTLVRHSIQPKGNLLIRPRPALSRSPYNFEIVLLDHGLYFDLDRTLRINYSKLWLALIAPASPENNVDRRKYAQLVGNVDSDRVSPCYIPVPVTGSSRSSILYLRQR
jgi:aarF domain-containing kinase